jgi:hypothetical protein
MMNWPGSSSAPIVTAACLLSFGAAPVRPSQTQRHRTGRQGQDDLQQATYLWNGQARQFWICSPFSSDLQRMEANQA